MQLLGAADAADDRFRTLHRNHAYTNPSRVECCLREILGEAVANQALAEGRTMVLEELVTRMLAESPAADSETVRHGR